MAWQTPKTNWDANTGILYTDLNRIEENTLVLRNFLANDLRGFALDASVQTSADAGSFTIGPGELSLRFGGDDPIAVQATSINKNLSAFATGNGNGSKAPGSAAFTDRAFFYVFYIYNSTTGAADIAIDSDKAGTNAAAISGFDAYTMVSVVHIKEVTPAVFGVQTMYSDGENFHYIYTGTGTYGFTYNTVVAPIDTTIDVSSFVPAMNVEAFLSVDMYMQASSGIVALYPTKFTIPAGATDYARNYPSLEKGSVHRDERYSTSLRFPVGTARTLGLKSNNNLTGLSTIDIQGYINGFHWSRRTTD